MQHTSLTDEKRNKAATHIRATALNLCYMYHQPTNQDNEGISHHVSPFKTWKVIHLILPNLPRNHRYEEEQYSLPSATARCEKAQK